MQQLQDKLGMSELEPTLLAITLDDPEMAADIAREIDILTGGRLVIVTWKQRFEAISSWIELQRQPIPIVLGLIGEDDGSGAGAHKTVALASMTVATLSWAIMLDVFRPD